MVDRAETITKIMQGTRETPLPSHRPVREQAMVAPFPCPHCNQMMSADGPAGSLVRCPFCQQVISVPTGTVTPTGWHPAPAPQPGAPVKSGMAVASLVSGIIGMIACPPLGLVGVILGIIAVQRTVADPQRHGGRGMAIAGICTGAVGIIILPLMISILLPSLSRAREMSKRLVCAANLKGLGTSMLIYAHEGSGELPEDWDLLVSEGEVSAQQFVCPSSGAAVGDLHACYEYIPGQTTRDDPRNVVAYDKPDNHDGEGGNVLFLDGHVDFIRPYSRIEELVAETQERLAAAQRKRGLRGADR